MITKEQLNNIYQQGFEDELLKNEYLTFDTDEETEAYYNGVEAAKESNNVKLIREEI